MEEKEAVQRYPDGNIEVCSEKYKSRLVYREISNRENERALILVEEEPENPKMVDEGYKPEGEPKKKVIKQPEKKILKKPATTVLKKSATTNLGKAFAKRFAVELARLERIREEKRANTERIVRALCERSMKNPRQAEGCE